MANSSKEARERINEIGRAAVERFWRELFPKPWSVRLPFRSIDYQTHPVYLESVKFKDEFSPCVREPHEPDDVRYDYEWVRGHAKENYERLHKAFNDLDNKADAIIKYLGGGTTVISIAALFNVTPESVYLLYLLAPAVLTSVVSICLAMRARQPTAIPHPPTVEVATKYIAFFNSKSEAAFLGLWHCCGEGMEVKIKEKSQYVTWSGYALMATLFMLFVPLLGWPTVRKWSATPSKPVQVQLVPPEAVPAKK